MSADVAIPIPATPGAAARAVDGPRWVPSARELETEQTDGRGVRWWVESVEAGGLHAVRETGVAGGFSIRLYAHFGGASSICEMDGERYLVATIIPMA